MNKRPELSIVTTVSPSWGETENFLLALSQQSSLINFEVILVDDLGKGGQGCKEICYPETLEVYSIETGGVGHLAATLLGINVAHGDNIISIDPDMVGNIPDISRFLAESRNGALLVYGVRVFRGDVSRFRFWFSRFYNRLLQFFLRSPVRDINVPMLLVDREIVQQILSYNGEFGCLKLYIPDYLDDKFSEIEIEVLCDNKKRSAYSFFALALLFYTQLKQVIKYYRYSRRRRK